MKKITVMVVILLALLLSRVTAQEQEGDLLGALVKVVNDVAASAVAQAVSVELSNFQALSGLESQVKNAADTIAGVGSQVRNAADTIARVGSQVRAGTESVAEVGSEVRAGAENLAEAGSRVRTGADTLTAGISAAVAEIPDKFVGQFRILIQTLAALLVLALVGFLAGLLIGIQRGEIFGCGILVGVGLIAALLAGSNLGAGAGLVAAIATGIVIPFAGTAIAIFAFEAARHWLALLRSLSASIRNVLNRSA